MNTGDTITERDKLLTALQDAAEQNARLSDQIDRVTTRMHELEQLIWEDRGVCADILLKRLRDRAVQS